MKTVTMSLHLANKCIKKLKEYAHSAQFTAVLTVHRYSHQQYPEWIDKVAVETLNAVFRNKEISNASHDLIELKRVLFDANVTSGAHALMCDVELFKLTVKELEEMISHESTATPIEKLPVEVAFTERREFAMFQVPLWDNQEEPLRQRLTSVRKLLMATQNKISEHNARQTISVSLHESTCDLLGL